MFVSIVLIIAVWCCIIEIKICVHLCKFMTESETLVIIIKAQKGLKKGVGNENVLQSIDV